jgi:hypothetical protein
MEAEDVVVAIFGVAVGLAGILLVFVGMVCSRAETIDLSRQPGKFRLVAELGVMPLNLPAD